MTSTDTQSSTEIIAEALGFIAGQINDDNIHSSMGTALSLLVGNLDLTRAQNLLMQWRNSKALDAARARVLISSAAFQITAGQ